jgi:predicted aldo/keto reductase-like oxidoreductase
MDSERIDRRDFLKSATAAGAVAAAGGARFVSAQSGGGVPTRALGRTGERVSCIGLGGYHIGKAQLSDDQSVQLIRQAVDRGITFLDNCWDYNDGTSEVRMGKALAGGYRNKVFLMTKIDGRTKPSCAQQIDESLQRLQTDHVDLMQFHEVIRLEDPDRIFAEDGAMQAMLEAKKAGKVRFVGFTGHKDPYVHLRMLDHARQHNFHFDTVQMPLNVMDAHFRSFTHEVLPVLNREGIAPLGMKCFGDSFILKSNTVKPMECLHYCLNLPIAVQITGIDSQQILDQAIEAARTFKPLTEAEVAAILERSKPAAMQGKFELYKTTADFDGTAHKPDTGRNLDIGNHRFRTAHGRPELPLLQVVQVDRVQFLSAARDHLNLAHRSIGFNRQRDRGVARDAYKVPFSSRDELGLAQCRLAINEIGIHSFLAFGGPAWAKLTGVPANASTQDRRQPGPRFRFIRRHPAGLRWRQIRAGAR